MRRQRTIAAPVSLEGVGLHTGEKVRLRVRPAAAGAGVTFIRTDLEGSPRIPAHIDNVVDRPRRTALKVGEAEVHTIEHFLAAALGAHIDNLDVEMDGPEVPGMDGSARPFVEAFLESGVVEQEADRLEIHLDAPVGVAGETSIVALPDPDCLRVTYTLSYENGPVAPQLFSFDHTPESFVEQVAGARTFVLEEEARALQEAGLGKGATTQNTLVFGPDGPIENTLRYPDEAVRHKVLDLLGDLFLLGADLRARVVAVKSGHALNQKLVRRIRQVAPPDGGVPMGAKEIQRILPHRYPFLLVDRILEFEERVRAVGVKNVTINEEFFQGHFPGHPVMPGVLQVEALAQLGGTLLLRVPENRGKLAYLSRLENIKFRAPVFPGDQLRLEVEVARMKAKVAKVRCRALVDGKVVTEGTITFVIVDGPTAGDGE